MSEVGDRSYSPAPIITDDVQLPDSLIELIELLAENSHENWARQRMAEGWRYGPVRDDVRKTHPCLVSYAELPESEKEYDRLTAMETIRVVIKLGFRIVVERS